jgi:hypothetical protein
VLINKGNNSIDCLRRKIPFQNSAQNFDEFIYDYINRSRAFKPRQSLASRIVQEDQSSPVQKREPPQTNWSHEDLETATLLERKFDLYLSQWKRVSTKLTKNSPYFQNRINSVLAHVYN